MTLKRFVVYFLLLSPLTLLPSAAKADTLDAVQARFGIISGDVGLLAQGAKEWIEPHEGLPIEPGDQIRTGEDGRVEILLSENAVWLLEPQGEFSAEHMDTNSGHFNLVSGSLIGKVDSGRTAGTVQHWEFNTPAALAVVHGTEFALQCSKEEGSHLGVFEGDVGLEPAETAEGLQPPLEVPTGQEGIVKRGKPVQLVKKYTAPVQTLLNAMPAFRRRARQIQNTWSPFTPETRLEARKKFVAPPPKPVHRPRPTKRKPKIPVEN